MKSESEYACPCEGPAWGCDGRPPRWPGRLAPALRAALVPGVRSASIQAPRVAVTVGPRDLLSGEESEAIFILNTLYTLPTPPFSCNDFLVSASPCTVYAAA